MVFNCIFSTRTPCRFLPVALCFSLPHSFTTVLGLARTGLIFTRRQEGAQPGGLTPPSHTEPGIPYHVLSCWVPVGGSWAAGTHSWLGGARRQSCRGERLSGSCSSLRFLLTCTIAVPVSLCLLFC